MAAVVGWFSKSIFFPENKKISTHQPPMLRSSHRRYSKKKKVSFKILQNLQENTSARVSFLKKLRARTCNFIKKETLVQLFPCEFCKNLKNVCERLLLKGNISKGLDGPTCLFVFWSLCLPVNSFLWNLRIICLRGELEPPTKFWKRGELDRTLIFRGGLVRMRGVTFLRGGGRRSVAIFI